MNRYFILLCLGCFFVSCKSLSDLYEDGKYDSIIRQLDKKASSNSLSKEESGVLLRAVNQKLIAEKNKLEHSLVSSSISDWQAGYLRLDEISEMQNQYATFTQLDAKEIEYIDIDSWDMDFSEVLYTHHVEEYEAHYAKYIDTENKNYIIDAYHELDKVKHFSKEQINIDSLQTVFADIGNRKINLEFKDKSFNTFELRHLRYYVDPSDSFWSEFGEHNQSDFTAYIILRTLDTDDARSNSSRNFTNNVVVGSEEALNEDGELETIPIVETYEAEVSEVVFTYQVEALVSVEIYFNKEQKLVASENFEESLFYEEVKYYMEGGDARAVPQNIRISNGSAFADSFNFDYSDLTEETLELISEEVERYLESY